MTSEQGLIPGETFQEQNGWNEIKFIDTDFHCFYKVSKKNVKNLQF